MASKKVTVIGGGLAGLTAAIRLGRMGFEVDLFEKNATLGGKMNEARIAGFRYDTGPSLLTMPFVLDELFQFAGFNRHQLLEFVKSEPICRYFFSDGSKMDASSNLQKMANEIDRVAPESTSYREYLKYSKKIYDTAGEIFLQNPIHEFDQLFKLKHLKKLSKIYQIDPLRTVHESNASFFTDERLVQLFDRYATYNGSDPFRAPATLNIIPHVEYGLGGYYIKGGMYKLIEILEKLATYHGVRIHKSTKVEKILHNNGRVNGIKMSNEILPSDYAVCGTDVVYSFNNLIDGFPKTKSKLNKLEPSLSGMVFLWGINKKHSDLAHHNIFFSKDYKKEFSQIFAEKKAPDDPTVYVSITGSSDPEHAPDYGENWFVLTNMPYLSEGQEWVKEKIRIKEIILHKLRHHGFDVECHIEAEKIFTPVDFHKLFNSNKGSIYGIASNSRTIAFKRPANRFRGLRGLYFAGGSVHPGGGIPLVILSGKMVADIIAKREGIAFENRFNFTDSGNQKSSEINFQFNE